MKKNIKYTDSDYEKLMQAFSETNENAATIDKNNSEFEQCTRTWNILEEMKNIEDFNTDKAWDKIYARFEEDDLIKNRKIKTLSVKQILTVAASIIVLFGIVLISKQTMFNNAIIVQNNSTNIKTIVLPDGSEVNLNKNSSITYPKTFSGTTREVNFKGEAFFNIERNPEKPFIIKINKAQIKVLGTSFNVNETNNNNIEVTVKTGKVEFCDCENSGKNITLKKGEKGSLSGMGLEKMENDNENFMAWMNKVLVFKSSPLSTVVNDINAAYHSNITIGDDEISSMKITTTFDSLSIDEVLQSIALTLNIAIEHQKESIILVKH